ncbi:MAG TPA: carboxypeptidase-like regulatory domain-containing protein, partial [Gemmatimonadaceae bacterium]
VGHVRRAGTAEALGGATVAATWTALVQEAVLVKSQEQQALAPVTPEGWFAICGIAPETPVLVRAVAGEDSSGYVRLTLPARGVGHQPLYVGGGDAAVRVTGTVRDAQGRPVPNGQAHVWGTGRTAPTSAQGEFVLDSVPAGTQTVEVRAIGYTPVAQVVHLTGAPAQLRVVLTEPVTTLPAATITARSTATLRMKSFYQRMAEAEKGINRGYFVTPEELERRKPPLVTNLFNDFPGVTVARTQSLRKSIVKGPLRHGHGEAARCSMTIYLDGIRIIDGGVRPDTSKGYLDEVVDAAHLAAVEVYPHPVSAPPQYQSLNGTCGVILLWSK